MVQKVNYDNIWIYLAYDNKQFLFNGVLWVVHLLITAPFLANGFIRCLFGYETCLLWATPKYFLYF